MTGRTMLGVWAHPDDEAYLSAGLMADHRRRGDRVVVVTATLGEHGTSDPDAWPPARLGGTPPPRAARQPGRPRRRRAPPARLRGRHLRPPGRRRRRRADRPAHRRRASPTSIVTFGPDGVTGHPDHRAVGRWATDAWARTPPRPPSCGTRRSRPTSTGPGGALNDQIGLWAEQPEPPSTDPAELVRGTAAARRARRPQAGGTRGPPVPDGAADRAGRPRHLPRMVADRVVPPSGRRAADGPTLLPAAGRVPAGRLIAGT